MANSSDIIYNGPDLPNLKIRNGAKLNNVLETLDIAIGRLKGASSDILREEFEGVEDVVLKQKPYKLLFVLCGAFVLPSNAYRLLKNKVEINTETYTFDEKETVTVFYQGMMND